MLILGIKYHNGKEIIVAGATGHFHDAFTRIVNGIRKTQELTRIDEWRLRRALLDSNNFNNKVMVGQPQSHGQYWICSTGEV